MPHAQRQCSTIVLALTLALLTGVGGCRNRGMSAVPVAGEGAGEGISAIDVTNWRGAVSVTVDDRLDAADVRARVRVGERRGRSAGSGVAVVSAEAVEESGQRVLRVVAGEPTVDEPERSMTDLVIRVPSCVSARVRTAGGAVDLVGVSGSIDVESGSDGVPGGPIYVRTGEDVTGPISLKTSRGNVYLQAGAGTSARLEVESLSGEVEVVSRDSRVSEVRIGGSSWQGRVGAGEHTISLRTDRGDAIVRLLANSEEYVPGRDLRSRPRRMGMWRDRD